MGHVEPKLLQRYFDGELRKGRVRAVAEHIESCSECKAAAGRLGSLGQLLRSATDDVAIDGRLDGLADAVMARVRAEEPLPLPQRLSAWFGEFLRYQKRIWVPPLAAAGAAAAAITLVVGLGNGPAAIPAALPLDLPPGSNVLTVSFGQTVGGTLFQVEGKDGSTTAVIWVDEGDSDSEVKQT